MAARVAALACTVAVAALLPAAASARTLTIRVTSVTVSISRHDVAPKATSKGDTVAYRNKLLNAVSQFGKKKGALVGHDTGTLTFTGPHTASYAGRATLPGGTLTLKGRITVLAKGGFVIPVAGGSGKYAKARGTLTVAAGETHVLNTYSLAFESLPVA
jgi:hypothetical protein